MFVKNSKKNDKKNNGFTYEHPIPSKIITDEIVKYRNFPNMIFFRKITKTYGFPLINWGFLVFFENFLFLKNFFISSHTVDAVYHLSFEILDVSHF